MKRYEKVYHSIVDQVKVGVLNPGEKLPSIRSMKSKTGFSISTILKAFEILEANEIIVAIPQSGFYVNKNVGLKKRTISLKKRGSFNRPIDTFIIDSFMQSLKNPEMINFSDTMPSVEVFPYEKINRVFIKKVNENSSIAVELEEPMGNENLRKILARRFSYLFEKSFSPLDFVMTSGGFESWNIIFRAICKPGDHIFVDPCLYFGALDILRAYGLKWHELPLKGNGQINRAETIKIMKDKNISAFLLMPNLLGPLNIDYCEDDKIFLTEVAAKYKTPIIEDDVFGDIYHDDKRLVPIKKYDKEDWVIYCGSFSKIFGAGLRLSYILSERFITRILRHKFLNSISSSKVNQEVIAELLSKSSLDKHIKSTNKYITNIKNLYSDFINLHCSFKNKINWNVIGSSFWINLSSKIDSEELFFELLDENIIVSPGNLFSPDLKYKDYIKINYAYGFNEKAEAALLKIDRKINEKL